MEEDIKVLESKVVELQQEIEKLRSKNEVMFSALRNLHSYLQDGVSSRKADKKVLEVIDMALKYGG